MITLNFFDKISTVKDLEALTGLYTKANDWAYSILSKKFKVIICESYSNIGMPWNNVADLDYVFVIEPFHIYVYEGERYLTSLKVISSLPFEENTEHIIEPMKLIAELSIPPFSGDIVEELKKYIESYLDDLFQF
jgi:predicted P-loop ATPase/GTPase